MPPFYHLPSASSRREWPCGSRSEMILNFMAFKCVRFQCQSQSLLSVGRRTLDGKAGDGSSVVRIRGVGGLIFGGGGSRTNFDWTWSPSLRLDSVAEVFTARRRAPLMPPHRGASRRSIIHLLHLQITTGLIPAIALVQYFLVV